MSDSNQSINTKDLTQRIAAEILLQFHAQAATANKKALLTWARNNGAEIATDDEDVTIEALQKELVVPARWPEIQFRTATGTVAASKSPPATKSASTRKSSKKAADFGVLKVPKGMDTPKCPAKLTTREGPCGKACKRVLPEHDPENIDACRKLVCNHMYCGLHVTKVGDNSTLNKVDKLKKGAGSKKVSSSEGDGQIDVETLKAKDGKRDASATAVMSKLRARLASQKNKEEDDEDEE